MLPMFTFLFPSIILCEGTLAGQADFQPNATYLSQGALQFRKSGMAQTTRVPKARHESSPAWSVAECRVSDKKPPSPEGTADLTRASRRRLLECAQLLSCNIKNLAPDSSWIFLAFC